MQIEQWDSLPASSLLLFDGVLKVRRFAALCTEETYFYKSLYTIFYEFCIPR